MSDQKEQVCSGGDVLIFACSGAVDVGDIADKTARKLNRNSVGNMFCTAGLGGKVEPILKKTAAASRILAIDGCRLNCVKLGLENAGFNDFMHLQLADIGMEKGKTEINDENITSAVAAAEAMLR